MPYVSSAAPTRFVEVDGRRLAYRDIGEGTALILCSRFRGVLDSWDPAFLDALRTQGLRVITFDYSGLGASSGEPTYNPMVLAKDVSDLAAALKLDKFAVGGWSLGGVAAQIVFAGAPSKVSHLVLLATTPPGELGKTAEQLFYDTARRPNTFEDEVVLFFEPKSQISRDAARRSADRIAERQDGRSQEVPVEWAAAQIGDKPRNPVFPSDAVLNLLKTTTKPILHIGGDHDIVFPIENWYALNGQLPSLQLVTFPHAGHGPHHQYPEASAGYIGTFIRHCQ